VRRTGTPIIALIAFAAGPPAAAHAQAPVTPPTGPSAGRLALSDTGGVRVARRNVALAGQRLRVRGTVTPYVAGQSVEVRFLRRVRRLATRHVAVVPARGGKTGTFTVFLKAPNAGALHIQALHAATAAQAAMSASSTLTLITAGIGPGGGGLRVRYLQTRLASLGYLTSRGGRYDDATARAVVAYHKVTRMPRTSAASGRTFFKLADGQGRFRSRFPWHGRHVEVSLSRQVLALFYPGGQVYKIITISSGKPSTPTVRGSFSVFSKTLGYNSLGMLDANYFAAGGFAIHGYHDVPTYAASHGCVRAPIPNAGFLYNWIRYGTRVDVYG
jgi:peptidoglycan hydrolase-like protein with peptidoglycan-binding domain